MGWFACDVKNLLLICVWIILSLNLMLRLILLSILLCPLPCLLSQLFSLLRMQWTSCTHETLWIMNEIRRKIAITLFQLQLTVDYLATQSVNMIGNFLWSNSKVTLFIDITGYSVWNFIFWRCQHWIETKSTQRTWHVHGWARFYWVWAEIGLLIGWC